MVLAAAKAIKRLRTFDHQMRNNGPRLGGGSPPVLRTALHCHSIWFSETCSYIRFPWEEIARIAITLWISARNYRILRYLGRHRGCTNEETNVRFFAVIGCLKEEHGSRVWKRINNFQTLYRPDHLNLIVSRYIIIKTDSGIRRRSRIRRILGLTSD